jgi:hypothetical protein
MMKKFNYAYLRGFIKENFGSNHKFAVFLGIGDTALYDRLSSRVPFTQLEIDKVALEATSKKLSASEIDLLFFTC